MPYQEEVELNKLVVKSPTQNSFSEFNKKNPNEAQTWPSFERFIFARDFIYPMVQYLEDEIDCLPLEVKKCPFMHMLLTRFNDLKNTAHTERSFNKLKAKTITALDEFEKTVVAIHHGMNKAYPVQRSLLRTGSFFGNMQAKEKLSLHLSLPKLEAMAMTLQRNFYKTYDSIKSCPSKPNLANPGLLFSEDLPTTKPTANIPFPAPNPSGWEYKISP